MNSGGGSGGTGSVVLENGRYHRIDRGVKVEVTG